MNYFFRFFSLSLLLVVFQELHSQVPESSVLKSGKWYKIKVTQTGIYKITYEDLKNIGFETPENIRIYGNGGKQLSYLNNDDDLGDLKEIPIYQNSGNDNIFGPGDFYLFYGEGVVVWEYNSSKLIFEQKVHDYSLSNYYFITSSFGSGKRINQLDYSAYTSGIIINSYSWRDYVEHELYNFTNSGRFWVGDRYDENPYTINFSNENIIIGSQINLTSNIAIRSTTEEKTLFKLNSKLFDTIFSSSVNMDKDEYPKADVIFRKYSINADSKDLLVRISINSNNLTNQAYVDYITINARCHLNFISNFLFFRDLQSVGTSDYARFTLSNASSNIKVWNITNHNNIFELKGTLNSSKFEFIAPVSELQEYVAVDISGNFILPIFKDEENNDVGWIENQNIHGALMPNLLIVTHPLFINQANELANLHREKDNLLVSVFTTQQVYNEFSSGKPDASAIRNLARLYYLNSNEESKFKYLLLFGDGSFDNRTKNDNNPNYIPTYQSEETIYPIDSYTSDDFYAMLEPGEWSEKGNLDIGVGRIPVSWNYSSKDKSAQGVVDKIKNYYNVESMKDWRNQVIFLADDGEHEHAPSFMKDTDSLTKIVDKNAPSININKIYLDAYQQISSSTGASYPEVETELHRTLNKGALIFNYMGHGGENGITQEAVFQRTDFDNLRNAPYFPLFITATCQVGRFDNVTIVPPNSYSQKVSAGEAAFLNPYGGAISMFTTTRLVYQTENFKLSQNIFNMVFEKDENFNRYRIGDIFRIAKNNYSGNNINKLKFSLLGDPAITLAYGEYQVITDSINHISIKEQVDTVNALGSMIISGFVAFDDSTIINDFNGIIQTSVYDKKYTVTTNGNDGIPTMDFIMQDKLLFHGKASVENGRFSLEFKLPKDISYNFGNGKICYYAQNGVIDAKGYYEDFLIGGTNPDAPVDLEGPEIKLYMNDMNFREGGITSSNPVLMAYISDENGINTTGNGIGHDLASILDEDHSIKYLLNDYFEGDLNSYKSGIAYYQFNSLSPGYHTIKVKAWDIYNNSSEDSIGFYVGEDNNLIINKLYCYPNPMRSYTSFQYSHNMPGNHDVTLKIYDFSGKVIYSFTRTNSEMGFVSEPVYWERITSSDSYVPPGVYAYTLNVKVTTDYSNTVYENSQSGRVIIIPE